MIKLYGDLKGQIDSIIANYDNGDLKAVAQYINEQVDTYELESDITYIEDHIKGYVHDLVANMYQDKSFSEGGRRIEVFFPNLTRNVVITWDATVEVKNENDK